MNFELELNRYKTLIEIELRTFLKDQVPKHQNLKEFHQIMSDYILSGGKRLRPLAFLFSYLNFQKNLEHVLGVAVSIELRHTYSLIQDDIMDEDDKRRGYKTIHKNISEYYLRKYREQSAKLFCHKSTQFGVSQAVLISDLVYQLSRKIILNSDFPEKIILEILRINEDCDYWLHQGQIMDILYENTTPSEEEYFEIIKNKTGILFGNCFELGAVVGGGSKNERSNMKEIGVLLGLGFQVLDDLRDLSLEKGHEPGSDIKSGKGNLLMVKTLENANNEEKEIFNRCYGSRNISDTEIKTLIRIMEKTGAIDYSKKCAYNFFNKAKNLTSNETLVNFIEYIEGTKI